MSVSIPLVIGGSALIGSLLWAASKKKPEEENPEDKRSEGLPPPQPPRIRPLDFAMFKEANRGQHGFAPGELNITLPQSQQPMVDLNFLSREIQKNAAEWQLRNKSGFPTSEFEGLAEVYQDKNHGWQKLPVVKASRVIERVQKKDPKILARAFGSKDLESMPWSKTDVVVIRIETWDEFRWFGKMLAGVMLTYSFAPQQFKKLGLLDWISFFRYHQFEIADPLKTSMENEYRKRLYRPRRRGELFSRDHYFARGTAKTPACPGYTHGVAGGKRECRWNEDSSLPTDGWYECFGNEWCYPQEFEFFNDETTSEKRPIAAFIVGSPVWLIAEFAATFFYQTAFMTLILPQNQAGSLLGPLVQSITGAIGSAVSLGGGAASGNAGMATKGGTNLATAIFSGIMVLMEIDKIRENTEITRLEIEDRIKKSLLLLKGKAPTKIEDFSGYVMGAIVPPWIDHYGWQGERRTSEYIHKEKRVKPWSVVKSWDKDVVDKLPVAEGGYWTQMWEGPTYDGWHHIHGRWYDGENENNGPFGYLNDPLATYFALGWNHPGSDKAAPQLPFFYLGIDFDIPLWVNQIDREIITLRPVLGQTPAGRAPVGFKVLKLNPKTAAKQIKTGDDLGIY